MAAKRKRKNKSTAQPQTAEPVEGTENETAKTSDKDMGAKKAQASRSAAAAAYQTQAGASPDGGEKSESLDATVGGDKETEVVAMGVLIEAEKERDTYLNLARQTQADFENYKKRVQKEAAERKRQVLGGFLKECLPAICDLNRVITEGEKTSDYETLHTGVKIMRDNLWKVMKNAGIVEIESLGKPFDPKFHEAMAMVPSPDHEPNTVMEVFQPGYMLDEDVIAPARVVVAAKQ